MKNLSCVFSLSLLALAGGCGHYSLGSSSITADAQGVNIQDDSSRPHTGTNVASTLATGSPAYSPTMNIDKLAAMERPETRPLAKTPQPRPAPQPFEPAVAYPQSEPDAQMDDQLEGLTQVSFATDGGDFDPCLSRDGKTLVFASTQHRPTSDIYIKSVHSRAVTQLTADPGNDVMPALSPDGSRVAFASDRAGTWNIYVVSTRGGQAVQLTGDRSADLHPTWSPDGKRLAFCRLGQMSGRWELWVLSIDQPTQQEFLGYGLFPQWSPVAINGSEKILFQRGRERGDRAFSVWTIDYKPGDAGNPTEIVPARGSLAAINPAWSPDGKFVVYALVDPAQGALATANADLCVTGIDGSGQVSLTSGRYKSTLPFWSTDGRVYFVSNRTGAEAIWSLGTDKALAALNVPGNTAQAAGTGKNHTNEHASAEAVESEK